MTEHTQCHRCGHKLKTTKSMAEGFGPVCKRKWEQEKAQEQMNANEVLEDKVDAD